MVVPLNSHFNLQFKTAIGTGLVPNTLFVFQICLVIETRAPNAYWTKVTSCSLELHLQPYPACKLGKLYSM